MPDMNGWEATRLRNDCFCLIGLLLSVAVFIMSVLACMTCFLSDDKPMPPASPSNNPKVPQVAQRSGCTQACGTYTSAGGAIRARCVCRGGVS